MPTDTSYTVRQIGTGFALRDDAELGWRWTNPKIATPMSLAAAEAMQARMGGVIWHAGAPRGQTAPRAPAPMPAGRAPGEPDKQITILRAHMAAGRWRDAVQMASRFSRLGADKEAITRAWDRLPEAERRAPWETGETPPGSS